MSRKVDPELIAVAAYDDKAGSIFSRREEKSAGHERKPVRLKFSAISMAGLIALSACTAGSPDLMADYRDPAWLDTFGTGWSVAHAVLPTGRNSLAVLGGKCIREYGADGGLLEEVTFWSDEEGGARDFIPDPSGGWIVAGSVVRASGTVGALLSLDEQGAVRWQQIYSEGKNQLIRALAGDSEGNLIFVGEVEGSEVSYSSGWVVKTDSQGNLRWQQKLDGDLTDSLRGLALDRGGNIAAAGYTGRTPVGPERDGWVVLFAPDGTRKWDIALGGDRQDEFNAITMSESEGFVAAGQTHSHGAGDFDQWVVGLSAEGAVIWESVTGGTSCECANSVIQNGPGLYVTAGYTQTYGAGGYDVWVSGLDARGAVLWRRYFGGQDQDEATDIVNGHASGYYLSGLSGSYADTVGERVGFVAYLVP